MPTIEQIEKLAQEIWDIRGQPIGTDEENWRLAEHFQRVYEENQIRREKVTISKRHSEKLLIRIRNALSPFIPQLLDNDNLIAMVDDRINQIKDEWIEEDKQ